MYNPKQPDTASPPPQMTEQRRPVEPGSTAVPGFQPKRRDDADKDTQPHDLPGSLPPEPGDRLPLTAKPR